MTLHNATIIYHPYHFYSLGPPPTPTFKGRTQFKLSSQNLYLWNVSQEWNTTDECVYPSILYDTYTSLSCPGHEEYNQSKVF